MALGSTTAKNKALDAMYGASASAACPATYYLALFSSDPASGGTEISGGGYARVAVTNNGTNFPAASGGVKSTGAAISFPTSSAAWSATATHFAFMSANVAGDMYDTGSLTSSVTVSGANTAISFAAGDIDITQP